MIHKKRFFAWQHRIANHAIDFLERLIRGGSKTHRLVDHKAPDAVVEIAPERTGHGLPLSKCEAYNSVYVGCGTDN
jgi:hypothetical protein